MTDREQIILELESDISRAEAIDNEWVDCIRVDALRKTVKLLKEQEPLAVEEGKVNKCVCGNKINRYWHPEYCGFCGKKLEWY